MKDVFARIEKKYRLNAAQHRYMLDVLAPHVSPDSYGKSRLESLYYDTPRRDLIARSVEKPLYKEKLRVRRYLPLAGAGVDAGAADAFVEIKKKYKGVVYKRRVVMSWDGALAYLDGMELDEAKQSFPRASVASDDGTTEFATNAYADRQIHREIDALLARYGNLEKSMLIVCDRQAFFGTPEEAADDETTIDLRITFDENLAFVDLFETSGVLATDKACAILPEGEVIMEIKCAGTYPLWLARALSAGGIYPRSFSKYGTAYQAVMGAGLPTAIGDRSPGETEFPDATGFPGDEESPDATYQGVASLPFEFTEVFALDEALAFEGGVPSRAAAFAAPSFGLVAPAPSFGASASDRTIQRHSGVVATPVLTRERMPQYA